MLENVVGRDISREVLNDDSNGLAEEILRSRGKQSRMLCECDSNSVCTSACSTEMSRSPYASIVRVQVLVPPAEITVVASASA